MPHLLFGHIDTVGDSSKDEEKNRYRVRLDEHKIVTGWIFQLKQFTLKNQQDGSFDVDEPVAVLMHEDMVNGVILGAINNANTPPKETDPDIYQMYFEDKGYVKYDRKNHKIDVYVEGSNNEINVTAKEGKVNIDCDEATIKAATMVTIDGKLTVNGEAKFKDNVDVDKDVAVTGKLDVTMDIATNGKLSATTGIESTADVTAGAGVISLLTHKHPTAAPGPPSTPIP